MVCQRYAGVQHLFDDISVVYSSVVSCTVEGAMLTEGKRVVPSPPEFCNFSYFLSFYLTM